ncbi:PAS domain S-box protein [Methanothermobacter marburgensis]|uniref:histidine kinase n=1 Tax=Methanothermobacter marburgensis (strain ATCC BAA-927 / DSM 2133 / JCM 14651 / NBRC 100331 / OCM 82 / Marburg) TaxID=79929 RepID=D9PVH4_METTM|nr:PAS domain S-box protein [Methanothermobacter marburgensis]ADL58222.1 predicted signal transduction histidine kinase [Methanothermobacter marburgensis str. Marburg]WBF10390.1 PAS domain S-box protein [Methanothermobacter marburgensis]
MNPLALISITAFVTATVSGIYIFVKNPESRFNRTLLAFSALVAYLSLTDFGLYISESYGMAALWVRMGFLWPFVVPVILHMVMIFTGRMRRWYTLAALYVPAFIFSVLELTTGLITAGPLLTPWGWTFAASRSPAYDLSTIWGLVVGLIALILVVIHLKSSSSKGRTQGLYLFTGLLLPIITGFLTDFMLPFTGIEVPSLTNPAAAAGVAIIAYGVLRFHIPVLSPINAAMDIVRSMNSFLIITDLEFRISYVNPAAERLTGFSAAELLGRRIDEVMEFEGKLSEMMGSMAESALKSRDGLVPVVVSAGHIHGSGGEHVGLLFTGSDIRPIKEMEQKLKRREERLVLLTEHMADGLGEFDRDFNFRYLSPSVKNITGYSHEHLINRSAIDFLDYVHPDDRENVRDLIMSDEEMHRATFRIKRPDGSYRWVEYVDRPIRRDGGISGYVFGLRDIHEHKLAEEALRVSREKFRELFRNMNAGVIALTPFKGGFRVLSMNPAAEEMEGVVCGDVKGMELEKALPGIAESSIREALEGVTGKDGPLHLPEVKRGERWLEVYIYRLSTGEVVIIYCDITLRKEYEERLRSSLREKEALLREVHHRVKNNFQIISSLINLQLSEIQDPAPLLDLQSRVQSMALVHELLYESEDITSIDMRRYIERLTSSILDSYHAAGIELNVSAKDVTLPIETAVPLGLIINELITNSVKYAFSEGGEITVELESEGDDFILTISDNGVGFPPDFVLEESDSLGLKLVSGLVDQLDGDLEVDMEDGTQFRVRFSVVPYRPRI